MYFVIPKLFVLTNYVLRRNSNNIRNFTQIPSYKPILCNNHVVHNLTYCRWKSKGKKAGKKIETESDEEEDDDLDEEIIDKNTKIVNVRLNSLRTDAILKMGLGMARNKIETLFYESKIRVNGKKIFKKSEVISPGDEIDIVKGASVDNPDLLVVARVEVVSASGKDGEKLSVKLRRTKSLLVENYDNSKEGREK